MTVNPKVIVATPVMDLDACFVDSWHRCVDKFDYPSTVDRLIVRDPNNGSVMPGDYFYSSHARARNHVVKHIDVNAFDYLLWLDIDIVDVPSDLVQRLVAKSNGVEIVAPFVIKQGTKDFWDIGGFVRNGKNFSPCPPYCDCEENTIEMDSVGCCYIVPMYYYRQGLKYAPRFGSEVEHISFMAAAKSWGAKIIAVRDLEIVHYFDGGNKLFYVNHSNDMGGIDIRTQAQRVDCSKFWRDVQEVEDWEPRDDGWAVAAMLPKNLGQVLDLGSGFGANLKTAVDLRLDLRGYTGVDISSWRCQEMLPWSRLGPIPEIGITGTKIVRADMNTKIRGIGLKFDTVLSTYTLPFIYPDCRHVFRFVASKISDGGLFVFNYSEDAIECPVFFRTYCEDEVAAMLAEVDMIISATNKRNGWTHIIAKKVLP